MQISLLLSDKYYSDEQLSAFILLQIFFQIPSINFNIELITTLNKYALKHI